MDRELRDRFTGLWRRFFDGADLPVAYFYGSGDEKRTRRKPPDGHRCVVADIWRALRGKTVVLDADTIGCEGGRRYFGFTRAPRPHFEHFLSYGIPGTVEGERYKKTPELVKSVMKHLPNFRAPGKTIVFKRWDTLDDGDEPEAVVFFARPDVLAGLFTLANFDEAVQNAVYAPFGSGCGTIVSYPHLEKDLENPRAVLGMFDVSARPCVPTDVLTFSVPMKRFIRMIGNMEESFLITPSWRKVLKRIRSVHRES
jgi:uncharacterized protein (DUF169 family)